MSETRKLAAILVADVVGYSRLAGADEDRTLARLRGLRSDLIDPAIAAHRGRNVKRTGDGAIVEFRSVVDAVNCAVEVQKAMVERNAGVAPEKQIEFRVGIHVGDVVEESDGDLMGDGVNVAARLEGAAKPGAICLSEQAYWQVKRRLDLEVSDLGAIQLKNIAEPIRVYSLDVGKPAQAGGSPSAPAPEKTAAPRLSIVVLPFANFGGDPEQEYFVDGVTESLTTDLSKIGGSIVIARNTAFTFKGKPYDVKAIGRELNVRYVLEGSVQRGGGRMRLNVQLIEAESGSHLWAERFDKPVGDVLDMQDEIVARLAETLNAQLVAAEARRAEHAPNPDSMDLYFQGLAWVHKGQSTDALTRGERFLERALMLDPGNIEAHVALAGARSAIAAVLTTEDRSRRLAAAESALIHVISVAPDHALAHLHLGVIQIHTNRAAQGIGELERALSLNRNLAAAHGFIGLAKIFVGRSEETEGHIQEALRLSPRDHLAHVWLAFAGSAKIHLASDEEAVSRCRRSIEINRSFPIAHFYLAAALANLDRRAEAQAAVQAGLALNPNFTISRWRRDSPADNPVFLAQFERVFEGLRLAGVPEQ
jgi:TolB-like protein/class 3 adenylate cyclase/Flp pilus assembly protein TadD